MRSTQMGLSKTVLIWYVELNWIELNWITFDLKTVFFVMP
jgi:hypothetical protein